MEMDIVLLSFIYVVFLFYFESIPVSTEKGRNQDMLQSAVNEITNQTLSHHVVTRELPVPLKGVHSSPLKTESSSDEDEQAHSDSSSKM